MNTEGMRNVLAAVLENSSVTQLLYVSTAEIFFDDHDRLLLRGAGAPYPLKCCDAHAEPRAHAECMVLSFIGVNVLHTAVIRPAMLMGAEVIMAEIKSNPSIIAHQVGDNTNFVNQTYVANAAHVAIIAADRLSLSDPNHAATAGKAFLITDADPRLSWDFRRSLWAVLR
ncbi:3-beta hydroxysteroid dehydrogenase/isomerase [Mycena capillaripes]|nr:3-beta hydroxysteroid dehydrogenase/isomerase [Mycena capillaripes]